VLDRTQYHVMLEVVASYFRGSISADQAGDERERERGA
jgi:hypothetical protein